MFICLISCNETLKKGASKDQITRAAYGPSTGITDPAYALRQGRDFINNPAGWVDDQVSGDLQVGYDGYCPPLDIQDNERDIRHSNFLTKEQERLIQSEIGPYPDYSTDVIPLPEFDYSTDDALKAGFYNYDPSLNSRKQGRKYGTPRLIWRIKAASMLNRNILVNGIGDLSTNPPTSTTGHITHKNGRDVDIRLQFKHKDGSIAARGTYGSAGYHAENTFKMVKAFIDVDPYNVKDIIINDKKLRNRINEYAKSKGLSFRSRYVKNHNGHIHIGYKN